MARIKMLSSLLLLWLGLHSCASKQSEKNKLLDLYSQILLLKPVKMPEHTLRSSKQVNKPLELASGHHSDGIPQLLSRITAARSKAEATRAAIRQHWGLADSDAASLDLGVGFTNRKGKAERGADSSHGPARKVLVGKLLRAVVTNDRAFTVAFAGTSVTAGHDNWFNQSYAHAYERAFRPAFGAAGGVLTVRNHAMGGNAITPSHFCAVAQLDFGGDLDLVSYEFAMIANRDDCRFEYFMRSILLGPRQPAFMAYTTSGVSWREDADKNTAPASGAYPGPKLITKQKCKGAWVVEHYAKQGAHFGDLAHIAHAIGHLPQFRSSKMMGLKSGPTAKAIHGGKVPSFSDVALGVEDDDRYSGGDTTLGQQDPRRRRLAPFHPGPGAHEWQGQMLAHAHLGLLLEALGIAETAAQAYLKETGFAGGGAGPEAADALAEQLASHWSRSSSATGTSSSSAESQQHQQYHSLPEPLGCHKPYCEARHAQCFSTYTPRSPAADLASLAVEKPANSGSSGGSTGSSSSSSANNIISGAAEKQYSGLPVVLDANPGRFPRNTWTVSLPPGAEMEKHASFGYLDFKFSLRGDAQSGVLTLRFTTTIDQSPLVVCQPQCPWGKCKGGQRFLSDRTAITWTLNGDKITIPKPESLPEEDRAFQKDGVCAVLGRAGSTGLHELTAEVHDGVVFMSHLLFF